MKVAELERLNELICNEILQLKTKEDDLVFLGGDMNRKCILPAIRDIPDIVRINTAPTRGRCLPRCSLF